MTPDAYWWAALAVAGVIAVLNATEPRKRYSHTLLVLFYIGVAAALIGVGGMLVQIWRVQ